MKGILGKRENSLFVGSVEHYDMMRNNIAERLCLMPVRKQAFLSKELKSKWYIFKIFFVPIDFIT